MRAIIFDQPGLPENVLGIRELPQPVPPPETVLIRVSARPIQPADFLFIEGRYRIKPVFPQAAGLEGVGVIMACGESAAGLKVGQRVAFRSPGAWAEYAVAPISRTYPVPQGISDAAACQFSLNPLTAWGLLEVCTLPQQSHILITAGRSAVARLLTKLAQDRGLRITLLVREEKGYALLDGDSGATIAKGSTVAGVLANPAKSGFYNAILDSVGGPDVLALIDVLEPRGRLVSYGLLDDRDIVIRASRILYKNMIWQGFGIDGWLNNAGRAQLEAAQRELWKTLSAYPELLPVSESHDLSGIKEAIRAASKRPMSGKVILTG